jgi:amidase
MPDIVFLPAYKIAKGIRDGTFSAVEVLQAHHEHIKKYNPSLNAIVTLNEKAYDQAKASDAAISNGEALGPLHGVPITFKDLFETEGILTTYSHELGINNIPQRNAPIVTRLLSAGAIILGKTNMPKNGADFQTNSPIFGRANNPWNPSYTSGGSTGGGAAAVSAGLSPLEFGNDLGGSLRIPAHFCGVYSLKPTEYRVANSLRYRTRYLRNMMATGPIARSVHDLKIALALIEGPEGHEWDVPPVQHDNPSKRPLNEYRIAWCDQFGNLPLDHETRLAFKVLTDQLAAQGCYVEHAAPQDFDFEDAWQTFGELFASQTSFIENPSLRAIIKAISKLLPSRFIPGGPLEAGFIRGLTLNYRQYVSALTRRDILISSMQQFMRQWDAWICPVTPGCAFTHRPTKSLLRKPLEVDEQKLAYLSWGCGYASIASVTGNPVVTLPVSLSSGGLPIGVQLVGQRWQDNQLLEIAQAISEHGGYKRPPLSPVTD